MPLLRLKAYTAPEGLDRPSLPAPQVPRCSAADEREPVCAGRAGKLGWSPKHHLSRCCLWQPCNMQRHALASTLQGWRDWLWLSWLFSCTTFTSGEHHKAKALTPCNLCYLCVLQYGTTIAAIQAVNPDVTDATKLQ